MRKSLSYYAVDSAIISLSVIEQNWIGRIYMILPKTVQLKALQKISVLSKIEVIMLFSSQTIDNIAIRGNYQALPEDIYKGDQKNRTIFVNSLFCI